MIGNRQQSESLQVIQIVVQDIIEKYNLVFYTCVDWSMVFVFFFFQAEDGIRDVAVTGVQTCALPISFLIPPWLSSRVPAEGCCLLPRPAKTMPPTGCRISALVIAEPWSRCTFWG